MNNTIEGVLFILGLVFFDSVLQRFDVGVKHLSIKEDIRLREAETVSRGLDVKFEMIKFKREMVEKWCCSNKRERESIGRVIEALQERLKELGG